MRVGDKACTFSVILIRVCTSLRDPSADPPSNVSSLPTGDFIIKIECNL
ncbi:mCG146994 [Mus musculus]|nr:mCG146994 [Mus musculus]